MALIPVVLARTRLLAALTGVALLAPAPVSADTVVAGFDLWVTDPGDSQQDFATTPIPADFFYPGSDPFTGLVPLVGTGTGCGGADTVVERLADAVLPVIPSSDTIPIEIVELSLRSVTPITVTGPGAPELWDLEMTLAPAVQPQGTMQIDHLDPSGGTYTSDLPVCPRFTFTRIGGPPAVSAMDLCQEGFPPIQIQAFGSPWTHDVDLPLQCGPPNPQPSSPDFIPLGPHSGAYDPRPLENPPPVPAPALGHWGVALLLLLIPAVGVRMMGRRAGARTAA